jgi:multiple sugar transport system substrate-binding protein
MDRVGSGGIKRRAFLETSVAAIGAASLPSLLSGCHRGNGLGPDELSFWQFYAPARSNRPDRIVRARWFENLVAKWNADNRMKIRLVYTPITDNPKLATAFAAGQGPDIFIISPGDILRYCNGGVLTDLAPYMSREAIDDFFPSNMATRTVDGKVYGLPYEIEPMALYYDKRAFDRVGLSERNLPATWEDLLALGETLRAAGEGPLVFPTIPGYYQNFTWYPLLWQCGGEVVAPDGRSSAFNSGAAVRALRLWQEAIRLGISPRVEPASSDEVTSLTKGYASICYTGIWNVAAFRDRAPQFDYGVFPMPPPRGGTSKGVLGGWAFVANARGKDPETAARFCVWAIGSMSSDSIERVVDWCVRAKSDVAPRKSALERATAVGGYETPVMRVFKEVIFPIGRGEPRYPPIIYKAISDAIQQCQLGGADPAAQAERASRAIDAYLRTYRGAPIL